MKNIFSKAGIAMVMAFGLSAAVLAVPADFAAKLASPDRPAADKARDEARRPLETMEVLGVQEGWTVVDVSAGGGWFTWVLSAAVGPQGKVLSQAGERALQNNNGQAQRDMAAKLGNVEPVFTGMDGIPAGTADAAVTALNLHDAYNFRGEVGAQAFLAEIFNVLKPGGVAAIIDHDGTLEMNNAELHRLPAEIARAQILKAGFEIVAESNILDHPVDDHTKSSNDESLGRMTDQFLFVVRKPA